MSIERVAYPLPVIVNGYACLNAGEMEMAEKNIDPARPKDGPGGRDAAPPPAAASVDRTPTSAQLDPQRLAAAAKAAADIEPPMLSYAPGAARAPAVQPGAVYSVNV